MSSLDAHLLYAMLLVPIAGAALCMVFPAAGQSGVRALALGTSLANCFLAAACWQRFLPEQSGWQLAAQLSWLPAYGVSFRLGLDGVSLALVALTAALLPPVILSAFSASLPRPRDAMICLLLLQASMLGALMATDLFLFYIFFEAMLLPALFLLVMWGGGAAPAAAIRFVLTTLVGSLLMLVGLLCSARAAAHLGPLTFAAEVVQQRLAHLSLGSAEAWIFGALALGFGIKAALFPLHGWLAGLYEQAPPWVTAVLAGVMGKLGAFAFLRYAMGLYPGVAKQALPLLSTLALVGVIYGACIAMVDRHLHRRLAFASLSHMGLMMLGLFAASPMSLTGACVEMVAHGLSIAGLFLLLSMCAERGISPMLGEVGGLAREMPAMATLFVALAMAFIGLPGLGGFVGELMIFIGTFEARGVALAASGGTVARWGAGALRLAAGAALVSVALHLWRGRSVHTLFNRLAGTLATALLGLLMVAPPAWGGGGLLMRPLRRWLSETAPFGELLALWGALAVLSTVLTAVGVLAAVQQLFFGPPLPATGARPTDLSMRERLVVAPLLLASLALGLMPQPLVDRLEPTTRALAATFARAAPSGQGS